MKRKSWEAPQLIVLSRSNPEEAVLTTCKVAGKTGGPNANRANCRAGSVLNCTDCSARSSS